MTVSEQYNGDLKLIQVVWGWSGHD